jgi:hypothetical protein
MQAIELDAQRTKGLVSHAAGTYRVNRYSTRFMVRLWVRSEHQASIEGTCNIWLRQLSPAPHVKR